MAGPGGGPPRRRYVHGNTILSYQTSLILVIVTPSHAKVVRPVSVDIFAATRTFLIGKGYYPVAYFVH